MTTLANNRLTRRASSDRAILHPPTISAGKTSRRTVRSFPAPERMVCQACPPPGLRRPGCGGAPSSLYPWRGEPAPGLKALSAGGRHLAIGFSLPAAACLHHPATAAARGETDRANTQRTPHVSRGAKDPTLSDSSPTGPHSHIADQRRPERVATRPWAVFRRPSPGRRPSR